METIEIYEVFTFVILPADGIVSSVIILPHEVGGYVVPDNRKRQPTLKVMDHFVHRKRRPVMRYNHNWS